MTIDGAQRMGGGAAIDVVQPHKHRHVLGVTHNATNADADAAVTAAKKAAPMWRDLSYRRPGRGLPARRRPAGRSVARHAQRRHDARPVEDGRPGRDRRGLRADRLPALQRARSAASCWPSSRAPRRGVWNRFDHRPLEGFVYAITPFNFTAIAGNLPTAPALMGNTVVWKPAPTQQFAAHFTMRLFEAAGLPPGVINMVTGDGLAVSEVALADPDLAGIHFTGSTAVFQHLWQHGRARTSARYRVVPAARRRDRRQGLRHRPPQRRRRRAAHRADPRRVRVPGAEVLGRLAGVRAPRRCGTAACATGWRPRPSR